MKFGSWERRSAVSSGTQGTNSEWVCTSCLFQHCADYVAFREEPRAGAEAKVKEKSKIKKETKAREEARTSEESRAAVRERAVDEHAIKLD